MAPWQLPRMNQKYSLPYRNILALWGDDFLHEITMGHPKAVQEMCSRDTRQKEGKYPATSGYLGRGLQHPSLLSKGTRDRSHSEARLRCL